MEDRWTLVPNGQAHWREGSHGNFEELGPGSLFFHLAMTANQGCDRINCLTCFLMPLVFLNTGLENNCMKLLFLAIRK